MRFPTNLQDVNDRWAIYQGDCCEQLLKIPFESVGFVVYSPPFHSLYSYSDNPKDMANAKTYEEFLEHYRFLVKELFRVMIPGRIEAVHCMDLPTYKRNGEEIGLSDFPGDIIRLHKEEGFIYHSRHCIWKNPLIAATRTKAIGLAHKQIVKDSSMCRTAIPDYILGFRKPGENPKPIQHPTGLTEYYGMNKVPNDLDKYLVGEIDPKVNKRSQWIWQQYASPVWTDIQQTKVLPFRGAKEEDDERHICPLQLQVVQRCLVLWSNPGDIVLTPFMGVGSEVYCSVQMGRKGVGIELKPRYFRQALRNLESLNFVEIQK